MAQNPNKVKSFLNDLLAKAKPAAEREFAKLTAFANSLDGIEKLEKWDGAYYSEKLKQQLLIVLKNPQPHLSPRSRPLIFCSRMGKPTANTTGMARVRTLATP